MISIRAVFFGVFATAVCVWPAVAEVNIIYPPKRAEAHQDEALPVKEKRANINQVVTVVVVEDGYRERRQARIKRALFRNWTGFIDQYSGPLYPF
jgi:hypothetical protein